MKDIPKQTTSAKESNPDSLYFDFKENSMKATTARYTIIGAFLRMASFIFRPKHKKQVKHDLKQTRKYWKIYYFLYHVISILFTALLIAFVLSSIKLLSS